MNTPVTTTWTKFTLSVGDFLRGLLVAVISSIVPIITASINSGTLTFDWKAIGLTALATAFAYLTKNFFTPSAIMIKNPEMAAEVKSGESEVSVTPK